MKVSGTIILALFLAACGTTSVDQHRGLAQRYSEAAQAARSRGDGGEAAHLESLAAHEADEAKAAEEILAADTSAP